MKKLLVAIAAVAAFTGCTRIETGEVGLRIGFDKQVNMNELQPGSFNQTLTGDVLTFPVRDVRVDLENKNPITADNTALADFDVSAVYSINPSAIAELYTTKSKAFHEQDKSGDILIMYNYVGTLLNNAAYKVVRTRTSLAAADARAAIEQEIKLELEAQLKAEKLDSAVRISQVLIRNIQPNAEIIASAVGVVKAQNDLKAKTIEVETARKEAERILALNSNAKAIEYMNAQATVTIAEAIKAGKVNTIVVPLDFKGFINVK